MLDPEMMAYNAGWSIAHAGYDPTTGCIDWPEQDWPAFERRLAMPASEQGYFYVQDDQTGEFLGHVHYEVEPDGTARIGLNVVPGRRGTGLGTRFMELLLERVWRDTRATVVVNDFDDDRPAAAHLHRSHGFTPDPTTSVAADRPTRRWRLHRDGAGRQANQHPADE